MKWKTSDVQGDGVSPPPANQAKAAWYRFLSRLDVASGFVSDRCYKRHCAVDFLKFWRTSMLAFLKASSHIVMDNYATHKTPTIKAWFARQPHYHVQFTTTSA